MLANLRCNKRLDAYSITSLASARIDCGTARPSALAVLRLRTLEYFCLVSLLLSGAVKAHNFLGCLSFKPFVARKELGGFAF